MDRKTKSEQMLEPATRTTREPAAGAEEAVRSNSKPDGDVAVEFAATPEPNELIPKELSEHAVSASALTGGDTSTARSSLPARLDAPLRTVEILNTHGGDLNRSLGDQINANGDFVMSGLDWGSYVEGHSGGGGDYEYSATVAAD